MAKRRLEALMKLSVLIASINLVWTDLEDMHENIIAQILEFACHPLVQREATSHGQNTSTPTYMKVVGVVVGVVTSNFLQVTHLKALCP